MQALQGAYRNSIACSFERLRPPLLSGELPKVFQKEKEMTPESGGEETGMNCSKWACNCKPKEQQPAAESMERVSILKQVPTTTGDGTTGNVKPCSHKPGFCCVEADGKIADLERQVVSLTQDLKEANGACESYKASQLEDGQRILKLEQQVRELRGKGGRNV